MKRILVVDDNGTMRTLLTELLSVDYIVAVARNGAEALASIREAVPDGILLDMMMPIMDGWAFLRAWPQEPTFAKIPIIVVSSETQGCLHKLPGVRACIPKPFDAERLLAAVKRLIGTGGSLS